MWHICTKLVELSIFQKTTYRLGLLVKILAPIIIYNFMKCISQNNVEFLLYAAKGVGYHMVVVCLLSNTGEK